MSSATCRSPSFKNLWHLRELWLMVAEKHFPFFWFLLTSADFCWFLLVTGKTRQMSVQNESARECRNLTKIRQTCEWTLQLRAISIYKLRYRLRLQVILLGETWLTCPPVGLSHWTRQNSCIQMHFKLVNPKNQRNRKLVRLPTTQTM